MSSIFISHAVADKLLVDPLFDLLQTGYDISAENIHCTSVDGAGIQTGEDFIEWIKGKLEASDFIILIITPNYFASKFCMAEMGAVWALNKKVFPLVIPNIPREVGIVMLGKQTAEMSDAGLDELRDELAKLFPQAGKNTPRWSVKKQVFISGMPKILENLPESNFVDRAAFRNEQEKVAASIEIVRELETQIANLQEQIATLKELKDKDAVQEIELRTLPSNEQYNSLLQNVKEEINGYSPVEIRCLYALFVEDWWHPSDNTWHERGNEIETALKSNWIRQYSDDSLYMVNGRHPRYQSAITAIERLGEYIDHMDKKHKSIIEEREKYEVDIQNLEYWSRAIWKPYLLSMD
jgi:hypothetical protein